MLMKLEAEKRCDVVEDKVTCVCTHVILPRCHSRQGTRNVMIRI